MEYLKVFRVAMGLLISLGLTKALEIQYHLPIYIFLAAQDFWNVKTG